MRVFFHARNIPTFDEIPIIQTWKVDFFFFSKGHSLHVLYHLSIYTRLALTNTFLSPPFQLAQLQFPLQNFPPTFSNSLWF